jgi:cysteine synthase
MKYNNALEAIGNTPMVKINTLFAGSNVNIFAKLEGQNPGGSIKDRIAVYMIEEAEKRGELTPTKTIIEATSGNMGIALSWVGVQKGYTVEIVMSEGMSEERKMMMRALGAKLVLTESALGTKGAIAKAKEMMEQNPDKYWFANQFNNEDNVMANYYGLAPEILTEVEHLDVLIAGVGTGGTVMGIKKRFKEDSPSTRVVEVIPPEGYKIQGIQNPEKDFQGSIYETNVADDRVTVSADDAFTMAKKVAKEEGLFVGMSSGAALFAVSKIIKDLKEGSTVVVVIPDRGEKYLSTGLFR